MRSEEVETREMKEVNRKENATLEGIKYIEGL